MSAVCGHVAGDPVDTVCVVRDSGDGVDPTLVVRASASTTEIDAVKPLMVEIVGDLDAYAAGCITTAMTGVDGEMGVVFDVGGVSFIDSHGLRYLETLRDDVVAGGGRVWLHEPSRVVRRLLAILDIDRFDICGSVSPQPSSRH